MDATEPTKMFSEQTQVAEDCLARIDWHEFLTDEDIDHMDQWYKMQIKKIRRICSKNRPSEEKE